MGTAISAALRPSTQRHSWLLAVLGVVYILLQGAAAAHAVENNASDHTHNGQACLLASIAQRDGDIDVPADASTGDPCLAAFDPAFFVPCSLCERAAIQPAARAPPLNQ